MPANSCFLQVKGRAGKNKTNQPALPSLYFHVVWLRFNKFSDDGGGEQYSGDGAHEGEGLNRWRVFSARGS